MAASCLSGGCETAREIATLTALISAHLQVILICGRTEIHLWQCRDCFVLYLIMCLFLSLYLFNHVVM